MVLWCQYKNTEMVYERGEIMNLSREKINICMARKQMTVPNLANAYGVTDQRMRVILNSKNVSPATAGKLSAALGVDVTDIIE